MEKGIIFCSFSEAVREHPDLVQKYLGSVVPYRDNFFAALNSAVFSDGSFVYIPKGVRCPMELSTYFRINARNTGQFERTLIVADDDSYVSYLEGCTAPMRDENQLHAAIVEIVVHDRAEVKYSTVQNWYPGDAEGRGGVYNFVTKRGHCKGVDSKLSWTQVETGSAITWKYPSCILSGDNSTAEFYSVAVTNNHQQADTGTKMIHHEHHADNEPCVVRFANPQDGSVIFDDQIRGPIEFSNQELDDLIIRRTDGSPTYNFCVVVDDWDMAITHVIRGEDHINNTPRQINILKALNAPVPVYAHVSMINGDDGKKLSKRHGAVSVMQYRDDGYLPEALLNYLVRLGWASGDQEIFSREEMIKLFSLGAVSKSASAFNTDKLLWLNHHYINSMAPEYVATYLQWHIEQENIDTRNGPQLAELVTLLGERCKTLKEMAASCRYFYEEFDEFDADAAKKHLRPVARQPLEVVRDKLADRKSVV